MFRRSVPGCGQDDDPSQHDRPRPAHGLKWRGQAIIEFALLLPILMLMVGAAIDGGRLMLQTAMQQRNTGVIADWQAMHPGDSSWNAFAAELLPDCAVTTELDPGKPGLVTATSQCTFAPLMLRFWGGLPISQEASAVIRDAAPAPSPTASPS